MLILGATTFKALDQFETPLATWQHAVEILDPISSAHCQSARIYNNYGAELMKAGRNEEALVVLNKAISLGTCFGPPLINAGKVALKFGEVDKARKYFEKAVNHEDPSIRETAKQGLEMMR
jgi:Tfp pilus assembly protein PilF